MILQGTKDFHEYNRGGAAAPTKNSWKSESSQE
jgi:hypothetical protein